ncbi:hypothetical protein BN1708_010116 [Verticillium longisporum]|uniref:Uncharacterized protein n=2 Tax=Verticillium longisporum TaxID=100787 RepID=A0A0G4KPI4_VERLO|nr:hypothetical protein BN1708_010116 [Verticillium longisporum]
MDDFYASWDDGGRHLEGVVIAARDRLASSKSLIKYFRDTVHEIFNSDFFKVARPLLENDPNASMLRLFIITCLLNKKTREKIAKASPEVHKLFREIKIPALIQTNTFLSCVRGIKDVAAKNNFVLAIDDAAQQAASGDRDNELEDAVKKRHDDGLVEWSIYCRSISQKHRAEVIRIGAEHFAALAAGTPAEGSSKRRKHSHPTRNHPQLFDEGYELDQSMASRALLSALELYLGATVFDGLEETHVRAKEGESADFTAHVLLRVPRTDELNFQLLVSLSARVGDEIAQAKGDAKKLRRKFGPWLAQATGLRPAAAPTSQTAIVRDEIEPTEEAAAAAAIQVFRHKNGLDRMLQVTLTRNAGWHLMEDVFLVPNES